MKTLSRKDLFERTDFNNWKPVAVPCPEWGGYVLVKRILADELVSFYSSMKDYDSAQANVALVAAFCVNEDGEKLFNKDDIEWLGKQPASVINRLASRIVAVNHLSDAAEKQATETFEQAES